MKSREVRGYELLKKETNNKQYYYHQNEHGDITHLTNNHEEIENSYSYDVFGNIVKQQENVENVFKYAGEQLDSETQQYYLRARFYNPVVGRFTQEDIYRGDGLNLYVYVINNPLLWIDPSGYAKCNNSGFKDLMTSEEAKRYDTYWKQGSGNYKKEVLPDGSKIEVVFDKKNTISTRQRLQVPPGTRSISDVKYGDDGNYMYYRETIFDDFGRRIGNNDFTDHGKPNVKEHTIPHHHPNPFSDVNQHGSATPGLHADTPNVKETYARYERYKEYTDS